METFWGSRDGADSSGDSACLPIMWLMFNSGPVPYTVCWLSLLLVVTLLQGFFSGLFKFLFLRKPTSPNSNLTRIEGPHENLTDVASSINIVIYLFIFYIFFPGYPSILCRFDECAL